MTRARTDRPERTVRTPPRGERLLPGRPAATDEVTGPEPSVADRSRPRHPVRAICCSGGGVRAAAFALGGLQTLNATSDADDPTASWYERTHLLTAVSGGSYIASSYALIEQGRPPGTAPATYAPGSPEDQRLRAHTRYLVDSKTQLSISLLGLVFGLAMNLLPLLATAYILAKLLGLALGRHALDLLRVSPDGRNWSMAYPPALVWTIVGVACAGALLYVGFRTVDTYRTVGVRSATSCCVLVLWTLAAAAVGAVLLIGVPALLQLLGHAPGRISGIPWPQQTTTVGGLTAALLAIVQQVVRGYRPKGSDPTSISKLTSAPAVKSRLVSFGKRVADTVLPWVGSALIVVLLAFAVLAWTWNAAFDRTGSGQWLGLVGCAVGLVLWQAVTDVNRTSLHRFYAQRLGSAFGVRRDGLEPTEGEGALSAFERGPELVVCATVNTDQPGVVPTGRNCAPFTFSPARSGISSGTMFRGTSGGWSRANWLADREAGDPARAAWKAAHTPGLSMSTADLEQRSNKLTLMDMVAVSGAAVSPAMGRMTRPSLRLLLGVANVRLGMWLPNPMHPRWSRPCDRHTVSKRILWQLRQPGLPALWREIVGGITLNGAWVYVTDGGHYENLGLVEALRRGATEIVAFDASGDRPFSLSTFGEAVETARADLGVEIRFDHPEPLAERGETGTATALAAHATATYANGVRADIYLCKAAMVRDLPPDLTAWRLAHPAFPNDSTGNQLYGDREFEAYRRLGQAAAEEAVALMAHPSGWSVRRTSRATVQHATSL